MFYVVQKATVRSDTFAEAWTRGRRLANALTSLGVEPGDRVAVLEENCLASSDFFLGTAIGNFVRVPLYKRNSSEAHAHMLRQTQCKVLVVSGEQEDEIKKLAETLPDLKHVVVRDAGYEQWLASFADVNPAPAIDPDDFYVIRHSAGTTGKSKGIAFSHRAWMNTERNWTFLLEPISIGDCAIHVGPISWFADIDGSDPLVSCGRPLPYTEIEIRDEDNKPLPVGEPGEIKFGGDNWLATRRKRAQFTARAPEVLIVGAGQAGLALGARLGQIGVGFEVDTGDDETGFRMKYPRTGGGYYIDVGGADGVSTSGVSCGTCGSGRPRTTCG